MRNDEIFDMLEREQKRMELNINTRVFHVRQQKQKENKASSMMI